MKRLLSTIFVLALSVALVGQTRSLLGPAEPYKLGRATTFDASGSSTSRTTRMISSDLAEAETLIARYHVDGPSIDPARMTKTAVSGALNTLDPHSSFFDKKEWSDLLAEENSGYTGIGATIGEFTRNGVTATYVLDTFEGSAAAKAGIRFGDRFVSVNGRPLEGKTIDDVRERLRGVEGSVLSVGIEHSDGSVQNYSLKRTMVRLPSVPDAYLISPGVGYIDLSEGFNYTTSDEVTSAIRSLKRQGAASLIIDMRGNTGGIVEQAVKVAERFLPAGTPIVTQRGRNSSDNRDWTSANLAPETMPLVVLVDRNTASASEIVVGAFQDLDRAIVIGERTFGKGLVQSVIDLPFGAGVTLTAARYLTPSGRSIQRDYSAVGRYEYFAHLAQASAIANPFFEAKTVTGRRVLGGDGIAPDREVASDGLLSRLAPEAFFAIRENNVAASGIDPLSLSYYQALSASNSAKARRVLAGHDRQIKAAISAIPAALELARLADAQKKRPGVDDRTAYSLSKSN